MESNKIVTWLLGGVIAFVFLGVGVPIMILAWNNLTVAFAGTALAGLFGATIGVILIGGGIIFGVVKLLKL